MMNEDKNIEENGKTFSLKTSGVILAAVIFIVIIIMLTIKGCTISKEVDTDGGSEIKDEVVLVQEEESSEKETENSEIGEEIPSNNENSKSEGSQDVGNVGEIEEKIPDENTVDKSEIDKFVDSSKGSSEEVSLGNSNSESLFKVDEPVLGESFEISALVSGKNSYRVEDAYYTYSLSLIVPEGDEYIIVKYFCSKRIYDEVNSGETVKVTYQKDKSGLISITSISR